MTRVLFITRKWPPAVGGMEVYCVELTSELEKKVDLTTRFLPGREDGRPPSGLSLALFFLKESIYLLFHRNHFDVIHYGDLVLFPLARVSHILGRKSRQVISVHGTDIAYGLRAGWKPSIYRKLLSWAARRKYSIDSYIANSQATADHCEREGFGPVHVVNLGVRVTSRESRYCKPEDYLLFVGRLVTRKGAGWFISEVLPKLPENLTLKIAGTKWDASESELLENPRVEFLGPVFGEDLVNLRQKALAVIMPNIVHGGRDFEGFGLTALEAGADGAVLLASAIDGIVDAVEDRVTGILVEPGKPEQWQLEINRIQSWTADERHSFLIKAKTRIIEHYNWNRVTKETLTYY